MATTDTQQAKRRPRDRKSEGQTAQSSQSNDYSTNLDTAGGVQPSSENGGEARGPERAIGEDLRQLVRERTYEQFDTQKERATNSLGTIAGAVRGMTQPLRDNGQRGLADYVQRAADELDRWSSQLRDRDIDETLRDVQNFARRRPVLFAGVAFGAGVLAARFLKSSGESHGSRKGGSLSSWHASSASSAATERPSVAHDTSHTSSRVSLPAEEF